MADARLRELERRWYETGDPTDGAAWDVECLRREAPSPIRQVLMAKLAELLDRRRRDLEPMTSFGPAPTGITFSGTYVIQNIRSRRRGPKRVIPKPKHEKKRPDRARRATRPPKRHQGRRR